MNMCDEFQSSVVISMMPEPLLLSERNEKSLTNQSREKETLCINLLNCSVQEYCQLRERCSDFRQFRLHKRNNLKREIEELKTETLAKESEQRQIKKKISNIKKNVNWDGQNQLLDAELLDLVEKLSKLKCDIETKEQNIKHDINLLESVSFYYEKYLQCNVLFVKKDEVLFTLNASAKSVSEADDFIRFTTENSGLTFQYVEMYPKLKREQELVDRFINTGDIQGFILSYRKAVAKLKAKK